MIPIQVLFIWSNRYREEVEMWKNRLAHANRIGFSDELAERELPKSEKLYNEFLSAIVVMERKESSSETKQI